MPDPKFPPITSVEGQVVGRAFEDEVRKLTRLWEATEQRLVQLAMDQELIALAQGGPVNMAAARQRQVVLMREVRSSLGVMAVGTARWAEEALAAQALAGATSVIESAAVQGATGLGGALNVANADVIALLLEDVMIDAEHAIASSERTMRRHYRLTQQRLVAEAQINQAMIISESRLENLDQRSSRLQREFASAAQGGQFVLINGRRWHLESYADIVARTRLSEVANESAFGMIQSMGRDLVKISDHGKTEPACDRHAGKVYSISGRSKVFPRLRERPPFHPNCRHIVQPFIEELKDEDEMRFAIARSRGKIEPGISIGEFLAAA